MTTAGILEDDYWCSVPSKARSGKRRDEKKMELPVQSTYRRDAVYPTGRTGGRAVLGLQRGGRVSQGETTA